MAETDLERKERERQEDLAKLRGLRPMDDDFMRCLFRDNEPLAQFVLRIILSKPDLVVDKVETQRDAKRLAGARSVSFDVYTTDSENKKYDAEIQRSDKGASRHRARYHSSAMDIENLKAGQDFSELQESYVIFITENDQYGDGQPFHLIERVDMNSTGKPLFNDGEHILYVNGEYRGDSDIGKLMHDFNCWNPDDMEFAEMEKATRFFKEDPKGVEIMCRAFEETRNEKAIRIAMNMIEDGSLPLEKIAELCELPLEKVQELAEAKSA